MQKNTPYQLVPLVNFLVTTCPVWNIEDHEEKFVKLSCHSTCNGWIDVLLLFDKIFLENFQEKWQWCIGDTFVSLKPCLPTYYSFLYCENQYFVFRSRRKMKKKKIESSQNKYQFLFFWTLLSWKKISTLSLSQAWITTYLICVSHSRNKKLSKLQRQKKIIPVKKIRKLDFDIILITYLLYMALMLCFGQKISFSVLHDSADQYIHLSTNYYFYQVLFFFSMLKRDHIGEK